MEKDLQYLNWLRIGYIVHGVIVMLFSLLPIVHISIGVAMLSGAFDSEKNPPPEFMGWFFVVGGLTIMISGMTLGMLSFVVARYLRLHVKHTFCFVVACITCVFQPLGTILGVFSIIVLIRESVKQLFNPPSQPISVSPPDSEIGCPA